MDNWVSLRQLIVIVLLYSPTGISEAAVSVEFGDIKLENDELAAAKTFLEAVQEVRDDRYGNVHLAMVETDEVRTSKKKLRTVAEIEYWSRDNQYFRVDSKVKESNNPKRRPGSRTRWVLAPDRYVVLSADSNMAHLTIVGWGSFEEGWDSFAGNFFVQAASRYGGIIDGTELGKLFGLPPSESERHGANHRTLRNVELSQDGSNLGIEYLWNDEHNSTESSLIVDVTHGVVLEYEAQNFTDGQLTHSTTERKTYDWQRFECIPSQYRRTTKSYRDDAVDAVHTRDFQTMLVDWEPVPLGVFSLEGQGLTSLEQGPVWNRRLWTLLLGLLLVAIVFLVKWMRQRGSD